jgi:hypothetical protein
MEWFHELREAGRELESPRRMKTLSASTACACLVPLLFFACGRERQPQVSREPEPAPAVSESAVAAPAGEKATAEKDAAFLKEMKEESAAATADAKPESTDERAAYEAWFKKYHLDLNDPKMLDADPDGDGASNREEFLAGTDPLDPTSHPDGPAIHKTIRLKEYNEVRLPIALEGVDGDKARIKRSDGDGRTETVKMGDTLRGLPLKVVKMDARQEPDKDGNRIDRSRVILEDKDTADRVILMKDLAPKTTATNAVLVSADGKTTQNVRVGDVFTWPGEDLATYKVMDISKDRVVLQQIETRKVWTVQRP